MNTNWMHHPAQGFRFSLTDGVAIVVCAAATNWGLGQLGSIAWLFPFVLGHFFLFCNVFRIPRRPELVWAGCFLLLATIGLIADWPIVRAMLVVLPVTVAVLIYSIRLPTYHGIFSKKGDSQPMSDKPSQEPSCPSAPACPVCGGQLVDIRGKLQCSKCHRICETCCEGGRG